MNLADRYRNFVNTGSVRMTASNIEDTGELPSIGEVVSATRNADLSHAKLSLSGTPFSDRHTIESYARVVGRIKFIAASNTTNQDATTHCPYFSFIQTSSFYHQHTGLYASETRVFSCTVAI
jgi:hypothetical protein